MYRSQTCTTKKIDFLKLEETFRATETVMAISTDVTPRGVGVFGWGAVCCASDE